MLTLGTQSFQLFKGEGNPVGLTPKERRHHLWIMGKTGQGKSTLLLNLLAQDLQSDVGVILIDPHGDLAERVLDFIPRHRINETIYLDAADLDYPIGLNPLDRHQDQHLVISGIISIFKKLWSDSWGPRLEHILRHSLMALWETPGATMMELLKLLVDYRYQTQMVQRLRDPVVKSFFEDEFFRWPREFRAQAIAPIQNKAGQLLASPVLRNILGQRRSKINFRKVLDGQILIVNLSKGRIGEDSSSLLGGVLITKIQLAALERAALPEKQRKDFYLYVDEFQNFATPSFLEILSEARKYRLNLTLAHQYLDQLTSEMRGAILGNVGTLMTFQVSAQDAQFLEKELRPFRAEELQDLKPYETILKRQQEEASRLKMLTPPRQTFKSQKKKIIRLSRQSYGLPMARVKDKTPKTKNRQNGGLGRTDVIPSF